MIQGVQILKICLCAGAIIVAAYDLLTGKLTENPETRKSILRALYFILILFSVQLIFDSLDKLMQG